ncbi:hypothetical protein [Terracidiphilus gabretensis]|uniref:hypothetical protein n=1 Tax=Terracidiphilus gabretensis TaxID=1577687 RepID=UPI00071B5E18|nr:hypothetical protein [Terracidiphilus gabretensis]
MTNSCKATLFRPLFLATLLATGAAFAQAQQPVPSDQQPPSQVAPAPAGNGAGGGMHRDADPTKEAKRLGKELGLNKTQVTQILPILEDRANQMQTLRTDASVAPADRRTKAKGIMDDSRAKLEAVMTDQQKQQFEQMQAARKAKRQQQGQQPPAQQPGV